MALVRLILQSRELLEAHAKVVGEMNAEQKIIKVSKSLLDDKEIKQVFDMPVGVQLYLAIGSCHLRSQYFNRAILRVAKAIRRLRRPVKSTTELRNIHLRYGREDHAAQVPWSYKPVRVRDRIEGYANDSHWNKQREQEQADADKQKADYEAKWQELLDALNGVNPWQVEWIK